MPPFGSMETSSIRSRFVAVRPVIEEILAVSGAVGLSYGVIHEGELAHVESFGYRDRDRGLPVDSKTMFSICSMTQGLVTSILGELVEVGKLSWDAKIKNILPTFDLSSVQLKENSSLTDILSMKSGMERYNIWSQSENRINFDQSESMKVINSLRSATELRETFAYNNWSYEIAEHVIKEIAGETWNTLLYKTIFEPLELDRTDTSGKRDLFTESYMVLDNGDPVWVPMTP